MKPVVARKTPSEASVLVEAFPVERMMSAISLADVLGVSRQTIVREMDAGRLAYHMIGSCRRIRESDAQTYIASRRRGPLIK